MNIRFLSSNPHKIREVQEILREANVNIVPSSMKIEELQTEDVHKLVRDKTLKAFKAIGKPLFVEHTGLYIKSLNDFPGGLTQIFWDKLEAEKFASIIGNLSNTELTAKTIIGYCDSRKIHIFEGAVEGTVPDTPRGNRDFQWDCVFIPTGYSETFAEMGDKKNEISMRRKALDKFCHYLKGA